MVFQFFFQATFGIAAGLGLAALLVLFIYNRFLGAAGGTGRSSKKC